MTFSGFTLLFSVFVALFAISHAIAVTTERLCPYCNRPLRKCWCSH